MPALNIPDCPPNKQKIKLETATFNYTYSQYRINRGQAHGHSIYPKHPYTYFKGK